MDWVEIAMEEYKSLRDESLESMKMQQSILTFGTATIGLVISAGFTVWEKTPLPEIVFLFLIPTIVYLTILIWQGEVARMFRAGKFIAGIERKINALYPDQDKPLSWECWLITCQPNGKTPHHGVRIQYVAIFLLFIVTSVGSILIGNCKVNGSASPLLKYILSIDIIEATVLLIVVIVGIRGSSQVYTLPN